MSLTIDVTSALYSAGLTEDGEEFIGHIFFVRATAPNGQRWMHVRGFDGVTSEEYEDSGVLVFGDNRESAGEAAEKLADKVRAHLASGGKLDMEMWGEVDPVYGSQAYDSLDSMGYFKAREKAEAH